MLADAVSNQSSRTFVLVAQEKAGDRLGFVSLTVREDVSGAERAHVADLAVSEDARGLGVGRALMAAAEAWAASNDCLWSASTCGLPTSGR